VRVIETAGGAPCAFAAALPADLGADVARIDRPGTQPLPGSAPPLGRGRCSVAVDLKDPAEPKTALVLAEHADILLGVFRPGMCERLGIGPYACPAANPRLISGRIPG